MKKKLPKDIVKTIQDQQRAEKKSNYTFRLPDALMVDLKAKCEENRISMTSVVEELLLDFTREE